MGRVREVNEDAYAVEEIGTGQLFVVADGMGGHESGDVASRIAVQSIVDSFRGSHAIDISQRLVDAIGDAHGEIIARQGQRQGRERMGTTAVALHLMPGQAHYAWVGDSRIYLVRDGELSAITRDHTLGRELLERGYQSAAEVQANPEREKLARALGMKDQWHPETTRVPLPLEPGDMFLLCTDGLYRFVTDEDILSVLLALEPVEAAIQLVQMANDGGGKDNITVQVIHADSREAAVEAAARGGHIGSLTTELMALTDVDETEGLELGQAPATDQLGPAPPSGPPPTQQLGPPGVPLPPMPRPGPVAPESDEDPTPLSMNALTEPAVPVLASAPPPPPAAVIMPAPGSTPPVALESADTLVPPESEADTLPPEGGDPFSPPPDAGAAADVADAASVSGEIQDEDLEPDADDEEDEPAAEARGGSGLSISRTLLIVGALGLFFFAFLGGITVTVVGVALLQRNGGFGGGTSAPEGPRPLPTTDDVESASGSAAWEILSLPEDRECEAQWGLLREHHTTLIAEPDTFGDLSVRIFRCFDTEAYRAVEAYAVRHDETKLREAERAIRAARRFLDPTARADRKLEDTANAVVARLGDAKVAEHLVELEEWESRLERPEEEETP